MRYIATFSVPFGRPFSVVLQARSVREIREIASALANGPREASAAIRAAFEVANEALLRNLSATRYPRRDPATWSLVHVAKEDSGRIEWARAARIARRGVAIDSALKAARVLRDTSSDHLSFRDAGAMARRFCGSVSAERARCRAHFSGYGVSGGVPMLSGQRVYARAAA
jgi:hypothetical protein